MQLKHPKFLTKIGHYVPCWCTKFEGNQSTRRLAQILNQCNENWEIFRNIYLKHYLANFSMLSSVYGLRRE